MVFNIKIVGGLLSSTFKSQGILKISNRFGSGCAKKGGKDRCPKVNKNYPCGRPEAEPEIKKSKQKALKSMWLNPFCDPEDTYCPFNPRFDDIYYVESDKAKRKYWQTWVACPPINIKPKKICCYAQAKPAPVKRRKRAARPTTACPQPCPDPQPGSCPKIPRRCHREGRVPSKCHKNRAPADCVKPLTPYPSYSECKKRKLDPLHPKECACTVVPMLCEVWAMYRKNALARSKKSSQ
ncbi:uncharacterized protein Dana_GF20746 [Drosophila ananassae]|uniref:Uncharacterized protein n=1 Tax=Drosophila ananassae TaxID=7217 RepID=B3N1P4_DROAN|nr:uncharacterized protein LOC6503438 [Drosophila ananassae]EDV34013.1 uncharacterized protein Dana_GF20746 [Drosophila ananassae]